MRKRRSRRNAVVVGWGMQKKTPPVIDATFTVVEEAPVREPIIKSWVGLWWFVIPPIAFGFARYAQIKGWW